MTTDGSGDGRPFGRTMVLAFMLGCSAFWASGFVFVRALDGSVPPFTFAAARGMVAATVMILFFLATRRRLMPSAAEFRHALALGTTNGWLPNVLTAYALVRINAATGSMIQATSPIFIAILAHFAFRDERLGPGAIAGVLLGFAGIGVLVGPELGTGGAFDLWSVAAMLGAALSYALGAIYARNARGTDPQRLALGQQTCSAVVGLALSLAFESGAAWNGVLAGWPLLLGLGSIATVLPMILYLTLIQRAGATIAGMVGYLQPLWASVLAALFLGEFIGLREVAAAAIVLVGVWLVTRR